jgi:hypothetical protein
MKLLPVRISSYILHLAIHSLSDLPSAWNYARINRPGVWMLVIGMKAVQLIIPILAGRHFRYLLLISGNMR